MQICKKAITILLAITLVIGLIPLIGNGLVTTAAEFVNGDADGKDGVSITDILTISKKIVDPNYAISEGGDVNADGLYQENDLREIEDILLKRKVDTNWYYNNPDAKEFDISTRAELAGFLQLTGSANVHDFAGDTVKLQNKITVNRTDKSTWVSDDNVINLDDYRGSGFPGKASFKGTFDGQGNALSGLYIYSTAANSLRGANLFEHTGDGTCIKNLKIDNSIMQATSSRGVSALCGVVNGNTTVENVEIAEDVTVQGATATGNSNEVGGVAAVVQADFAVNDTTVKCNVTNGTTGTMMSAGMVIGTYNTNNKSLALNRVRIGGKATGYNAGNVIGLIRENTVAINLTMDDVAMAANLDGSKRKADIAGYSWKACTVTDTFNKVYRLGDSSTAANSLVGTNVTLENKGETANTIKNLLDIPSSIIGYDDTYKDTGLITETNPIPDTSWYNTTDTSFTLADKADFLGFLSILQGTSGITESFSGKTVTLATDIVFNQGNSDTWYPEEEEFINLKDESVGMPSVKFSGTFDGGNHTVSGVYMKDTTEANSGWSGIFPYTGAGAIIQNFNITNSYFEGYRYTGALIAQHGGGSGVTIKNVNVDAKVVSKNSEAGGLVGASTGKVMVYDSIINCDVHCRNANSNGSAGGVVGRMMAESPSGRGLTLENTRVLGAVTCATDSEIQLGHAGGVVGCLRNKATTAIEWQITLKNVSLGNRVKGACDNTTGLLVGGASEETTNALNIINTITNLYILEENAEKPRYGENNYLKPTTNPSHIVASLDQMALKSAPYAANTAWYDDNETIFSIWNVEQFLGFMSLANGTDATKTFSGKTVRLEKNITINDQEKSLWNASRNNVVNVWNYISGAANSDPMFIGIFDGCGHTISGFCAYTTAGTNKGAALFTRIGNGATVKNLKMINSAMENKTGTGRYAGGIGGYTSGGLNIENVQINANVTAGSGDAGGLVGKTDGNLVVKNSILNCTVLDSVYNSNTSGYAGAGGLVGCADGSRTYTLENVKIDGSVTGASNAGGILGMRRTSALVLNMKDVVIASDVSSLSGTTATATCNGQIIGKCNYNTSGTVTDNFKNVFILKNDETNKDISTYGSAGCMYKNYGIELITGLDEIVPEVVSEIIALSYNVLGIENASSEYEPLETRADKMASWIKNSGADIIAIQEGGCEVKWDVNNEPITMDNGSQYALGYDMSTGFANKVTEESKYASFCAKDDVEFAEKVKDTITSTMYGDNYWPNTLGLTIFYNTERFAVKDKGIIPYTIAPENTAEYATYMGIEAGSTNNYLPAWQLRGYQWMLLTDKQTGKDVFVTNTHWSVDIDGYTYADVTSTGEQLRQLEAATLLKEWNTIKDSAVVIGAGDYNCKVNGAVKNLTTNTSYVSTNKNGIDNFIYDNNSILLMEANYVEEDGIAACSDHLPFMMKATIK